jgi:tRNA acetyltransferase TAN1
VSGREKQSVREAINILGESLESLLGDNVSDTANGDTSPHGETKEDISSLLAGEIADLKDKKKQDFVAWEMGIPSIAFLECCYKDGPSASDLVFHMLDDVKKNGQNKSRFCKRFYPIDYSTTSALEDIKALGETIAREHFPKDISGEVKFSVDCERRAHAPDLERIDVIHAFAFSIPQPPYKVDLNNPEKTVLVNVVKGTCGASVVRDYRALQKYNLLGCASKAGNSSDDD